MVVETDVQFLARMLLSVKEGDQVHGSDAMRLRDLANNGPGPVPHDPQGDTQIPAESLLRKTRS
jgi:hypothetical protein